MIWKIDHRVYLHRDVVLGDDGLGREVRDLLLERDDLGDALDEGQLEVQTDVPGGLVGAQPLNYVGLGLLHHTDAAHENDDDHEHYDTNDDVRKIRHGIFLLFFVLKFNSLLKL